MKLDIRELVKMQTPVFTDPVTLEEIAELWDDSEEDIKIDTSGRAWCCGHQIAEPRDCNADPAAIQRWMDSACYWPNIWEVNDHGNVSLFVIQNGELVMLGGMV